MKLFSDSRWLLKCGTGVLPLSIFQYSWRRLNIHVTNKATFGKASDWATVQTAKRLLWLPLPSWEPESWFKEKSSARSDQIWCVARIHADEHQRCFYIYIYILFRHRATVQHCTELILRFDLCGRDLLQILVVIHNKRTELDFVFYTKTSGDNVSVSFDLSICI